MDKHFIAELTQFLGVFLALSVVVLRLLRRRSSSPIIDAIAILACACALLIPLGGLQAFEYVISFIGHISVTTVLLLAISFVEVRRQDHFIGLPERMLICAAVGVGGAVLYGSAYGLTAYDFYQLGFQPGLTIVVLLLAFVFVVIDRSFAAAIIVISVAAFRADILQDGNLWDYLLDPLVTIYAVAKTVMWPFRTVTKRNVSPQ